MNQCPKSRTDRAGRSFVVGVSRGRNFGDDIRLYEGNLTFRISDEWNVAYDFTRLEATPDLAGRTTWIHVLRSTYYFTNDLFLKIFLQTNTSIDKENAQLLFVWRILPPFGSLQVAYQRGTSELGQTSLQGDTLFTKLSMVVRRLRLGTTADRPELNPGTISRRRPCGGERWKAVRS